MSGVESTGFVGKTVSEILAEIEADEKAVMGSGINLLATSVLGQLNGVMAGPLGECWEVMQAVYSAAYPDSASDAQLEGVASITGALRRPATRTTVTIHCTGTTATALAVGRVISTGATDRFTSTEAATIAAATAWAQPVAYAVGAIVTSDGNIYVCTIAGTSGLPALTGTGDGIVDGVGTLRWNFVGDGAGYATVPFEAEEYGVVAASADAIDTEDAVGAIETPVAGWSDCRNLTDGTLGRDIETNAAFRIRREALLSAAGAATVNAIRADIIAVAGVLEAFVFSNTTSSANSDGMPQKSYEAVVNNTAATDAGAAAGMASANAQTYNMADGETLLVAVDGAGAQTATFNNADFVDINAATAAEIALVINTDIAGATAQAVTEQGQTYVYIASDTTGALSSIEITGGTESALGFPESPTVANGIDSAVAQAVFNSGAAGIEPHGTIRVLITDDQGFTHLVGVTNPTALVVEMQLTVTTDDDYPTDGDDQLKTALAVTLPADLNLSVGGDVIYERFQAACFTVSGVTDITLFNIRFTGDAWGIINLPVGGRELATFDTTDVTIV